MKDDTRAKLLYAQLDRLIDLSTIIKDFCPNYDNAKLCSSVITDNGKMVLFSGVFVVGGRLTVLPFSLAFYSREERALETGPSTLVIVDGRSNPAARARAKVLAFLSIIDYMIDTGLLDRTLGDIIGRVTAGGKLDFRARVCDEYADFKASAIKALPYDLSPEFLGEEVAAA